MTRPFAAAPESTVPSLFNTGVLLVRPSSALFASLLDGGGGTSLRDDLPSYDGGDQGFLNSLYSDWYVWDAAHRMPPTHNFAQHVAFGSNENALRQVEGPQGGGVAIMHFMGSFKPWHYNIWRTVLPSRESVEGAAMRRLLQRQAARTVRHAVRCAGPAVLEVGALFVRTAFCLAVGSVGNAPPIVKQL